MGAILFIRAGTLMALPFDMKRLEPAGDPFPVAQEIAVGTNSDWLAASSYSGVLAYVSGQHSDWQYIWRDRQGKNLGAIGDAGGVVMISPDGKRLVGDPGGAITILDFGRGVTTRLTFGPSGGMNPAWSPDGRYVAYNGSREFLEKPRTERRRRTPASLAYTGRSQELVARWALPYLCANQSGNRGRPVCAADRTA